MISVEVLHGKDTMLFEEWFGVLLLEEFIIESLLEERPDSSTSFELIKVCLFVPKEDSDAMLLGYPNFCGAVHSSTAPHRDTVREV